MADELHYEGKKTSGAYWRPRLKDDEHGWQMRQTISVLTQLQERRSKTCETCGEAKAHTAFVAWADMGSRTDPDALGSLARTFNTCNECRGVVRDTSWQDSGRCAGRNPDWWFADDDTADQARALTYCRHCPVAAQCLADAFQTEGKALESYRPSRHVFGVRGGLRVADRVAYHESYRSRGGNTEAARSIIQEVSLNDTSTSKAA